MALGSDMTKEASPLGGNVEQAEFKQNSFLQPYVSVAKKSHKKEKNKTK